MLASQVGPRGLFFLMRGEKKKSGGACDGVVKEEMKGGLGMEMIEMHSVDA